MEAVKRLKDKFLKGGGAIADFEAIGRGFLELGDTELQDGSTRPNEARELARKCFQGGALIQMSCYDGRGRPQGDAVIIFERWVDEERLLFKASHLVASDEYYEWWSVNDADFSKLIFHICEKPRNRCKVIGGADEETVHITKWRMASPQTLIGNGFGSTKALSYLANALDYHLATMRRADTGPVGGEAPGRGDGDGDPAAPVARPAVQTTGLDGAAVGLGRLERGADEMVDDLLALAQEAKKGPAAKKKDPRKDRSSEKGLGRLLADRAAAHGEEARERRGDSSCLRLGILIWPLNVESAGGALELSVRVQPTWLQLFCPWASALALASCSISIGGWPCGNLRRVADYLVSWSSERTGHGQTWVRPAQCGLCIFIIPPSCERWKRVLLLACRVSLRKNRNACGWPTSSGASLSTPQVFVGKEVHTLQFRRPLFSVYDHVWKLISGESDRPFMDGHL